MTIIGIGNTWKNDVKPVNENLLPRLLHWRQGAAFGFAGLTLRERLDYVLPDCSLHLGDSVECLEGAGDQGQVPAEDVGFGVDQPRDRVVGCWMEQLMNTLHTRDLGMTIDQSGPRRFSVLTRISNVTSRMTIRSALY